MAVADGEHAELRAAVAELAPTPHADRDRTEPPRTYAEGAFWPPAAPAAYDGEAIVDSPTAFYPLDEPVPFVLADEPVGVPVVVHLDGRVQSLVEWVRGDGDPIGEPWRLDEGDTGTPLLPAAPEGIVLQCAACPETLADTRGGRLVHHDDGSHTYLPPEPRGLPEYLDDLRAENARLTAEIADRESERADLRDRVDKAEAEVERQATLLRAINDCHLDPARAILQADRLAGEAIIRAHNAEAAIARVRALMAHLHTDLVYVGDLRAALEGP